tara:strand:- start:6 stop:545 length:540 start_codon:yes stop_codon:yes gene_type:complete
MIRFLLILLFIFQLSAEEMIIGKEKIKPGIDITFEAAPKDTIHPKGLYLEEDATDIHIEMLANWSADNPYDFPKGGFVAYLDARALIENHNNDKSLLINLSPHINLIDSLHYAKNLKLPGSITDKYNITFFIEGNKSEQLGIHNDWHNIVGKYVTKHSFTYKNLSFEKIAKSVRDKKTL